MSCCFSFLNCCLRDGYDALEKEDCRIPTHVESHQSLERHFMAKEDASSRLLYCSNSNSCNSLSNQYGAIEK